MQPKHCPSFVDPPAASHTFTIQTITQLSSQTCSLPFPPSPSPSPSTHTHIVWNCLKLFEKGQGLGLVHLFRLFLHVSCVSWIQFIVQYLTGVELSCPWWNRVQRLVVLAWGALSCMWWHVSALSLRRVLTSVFLLYAIWQSHWNGMLLAQVWLFKANIS